MVDLWTHSSIQSGLCVSGSTLVPVGVEAALIQQVRAAEGSALQLVQTKGLVTQESSGLNRPLGSVSAPARPVLVGLQVSADGSCPLCSPFPPAGCKSSAPKLCLAFFFCTI